jgi:hypothetical protein
MKALIVTFITIGQLSSIQISQAQGFYAVSRPTVMLPARGVFFGSVLSRPQAATGMVTQTFVQQKQPIQSNTQLAQKHAKPVSRIQILQQIEGLWNQVRRHQTQAMYQLAKIYENGNPLPPQPAMSRRLLVMAARKGHQQAAADLRKLTRKRSEQVSGRTER